MSNAIKMVLLSLIAITATSVVFQENAILLLAIALIGVLLILWHLVGNLLVADDKNAMLHAIQYTNVHYLFQQVQALRQQSGLPPLETGSNSLDSLMKSYAEKAGPTQKNTTGF